ncbi:MAG: FAD-dependent oxidoreductase [Prolixibacteraceae bacterium]
MNNKLKLLIIGFLSVYQAFPQSRPSCDVLVYGGTAAGVMASIAAAGEGASVLLVEPGSHLGGMLTGGLSHTDYGDRAVIGGLALEFYQRVADHYQKPLYFWRGPEPHVGEQILKKWLEDSRVKVIYNERLKSVRKSGKMIGSVEMSSGRTFRASVLIDATYEGDLIDRAGVSWTVGRESVSEYHESWAGRQPLYGMRHNFGVGISPFADEKNEKLLPLIHHKPMVKEGEADSAVQAYCFRLIMTNDPANRITIERPENYDPARYELLRRYLKKLRPADLNGTGVIQPFINLPGNKAEINSSGPISTNLYDGSNWAYPDADYPLRDKIWADHLAYTHGLLYFIGNDPSVPEKIRRQAQEWGLCKDEFADTDHWPHQLYVREARRMLGEYVLTQHDLQTNSLKYDAIGMGSYNMDIRHVQRTWIWASHFPELFPETSNEGYISIPVKPYEIPYRSLLPRYEECANLIVPVCISSSHLAFASVRMEPQFMILGQAAGVAAAMAVRQKLPVHRIDIASLQKKLTNQGQIISLEENPNGFFQQGNTVVVDDDLSRFVKRIGSWHASENPNVARKDITYRFTDSREYAGMTYQPYLPASGKYRIYGWWAKQETSATKVPVEITCGQSSETVFVNQRETGDGWVLLGTFDCEKGSQTRVTISNRGADGIVIADAFKFTRFN